MQRKLMALAALTLLPSLAFAQERDSVRRDTLRQQRDTIVSETARGRVEARGTRNLGLDMDEARQLQQALNDMGCDAGAVDGIVGARTRRAIACARRQHNITGNDLNELFRAMNLDITVEGGAAAGGRMRRDTTGAMRDTSGMRMRRDTGVRRDTSYRRDTTRMGPPRRDTTMRRDTSGTDTSRTRSDSTPNRPPR